MIPIVLRIPYEDIIYKSCQLADTLGFSSKVGQALELFKENPFKVHVVWETSFDKKKRCVKPPTSQTEYYDV